MKLILLGEVSHWMVAMIKTITDVDNKWQQKLMPDRIAIKVHKGKRSDENGEKGIP